MRKNRLVPVGTLLIGTVVGALIISPALGRDHGGESGTAAAGEADQTKVVISKNFQVPNLEHNGGNVFCPEGFEATGGGVDTGNFYTLDVLSSTPIFGPKDNPKRALDKEKGRYDAAIGWQGYTLNEDDETRPIKVSVICTRK